MKPSLALRSGLFLFVLLSTATAHADVFPLPANDCRLALGLSTSGGGPSLRAAQSGSAVVECKLPQDSARTITLVFAIFGLRGPENNSFCSMTTYGITGVAGASGDTVQTTRGAVPPGSVRTEVLALPLSPVGSYRYVTCVVFPDSSLHGLLIFRTP